MTSDFWTKERMALKWTSLWNFAEVLKIYVIFNTFIQTHGLASSEEYVMIHREMQTRLLFKYIIILKVSLFLF